MQKELLPKAVKNLSTDSLRMFVVLAEMRSISGTAQIISRSQPAVSLQLKKLEETLDTTLFRRNKGTFNLTRNGEIVLRYAKEILELNHRLLDELSQHNNQETVRLGIPNDFVQFFCPDTFSQFRELFPHIHFEVYEDLSTDLMVMLHKNQLDIALTLLPKPGGKYCTHSVRKELFWVGHDDLTHHKPLPIISCFNGCSYRNTVEASLRKSETPFKIVLTTNNFYTIYDAIERGLGIHALLNNDDNISRFESYKLSQLPPLEPLYLGLHIKQVNISPALSALSKHIKHMM